MRSRLKVIHHYQNSEHWKKLSVRRSGAGGVAQMVEHLPIILEALGLKTPVLHKLDMVVHPVITALRRWM